MSLCLYATAPGDSLWRQVQAAFLVGSVRPGTHRISIVLGRTTFEIR